ncbi:Wzz/FepE/Etk N-terminal domain-containing protein [Neolewinella persica]|uniref:Wzz/FepE/Etk N-terminal domain-containing protein n=1 Tax=Neolewinella persica TaxID=70998 RepID=UPI0003624661|nr:Wzz/FepE/Etk N-terminal domain-containing protein [Neolewinella persica]
MASDTKSTKPAPPHLIGVLRSLWQWRMPIIYVTLAGTLLAVIISLLVPEYYTSRTAFLTISPDQVSIDGVFGNNNSRIQFYGTGDDIDRLMAVAESDALVDQMVQKFHLYKAYDIDSTKKKAPVYVRREFLGLYDVTKTPRDAIELEISDRDPIRAADMARAAREEINKISLELIRGTQERSAAGLRSEVQNREETLKEINRRLGDLREKYGVYNTRAQSEALAQQTTSMQSTTASTEAKLLAYRQRGGRGARDSIAKYEIQLAGLRSARTNLDSQLVRLNLSIGSIENLEEEREDLNDALSEDRIRLKQFETILRSEQRALEVVEEAKVPVAKSYPIRSLMVIGAFMFSFIIAVVGALLIDTARGYDWREIFS